MTEAEVIDRINSTIKKNGKNAITGEEMNFVLKAIIQLIADSGGVVNWGDIEGTIADQLDLASALSGKVDTVSGKGLSTNDFTNTLKTKLDNIEAGAEVNVNADWNAVSGDAQILNKPIIPDASDFVAKTDYSPEHSILAQQSGTGSPTAVTIGTNQILGRLSGGGSTIEGLSVSQVKTLLDLEGTNTGDETQSSILSKLGWFNHVHVVESTPVTIVTTETIMESYLIPAGTFVDGGVLKIENGKFRIVGGAAAKEVKVYIGPNENNLTGATQIALLTIANSSNYAPLEKKFTATTTALQGRAFNVSANNDDGADANARGTVTVDWATDRYIIITGKVVNGADALSLFGLQIKNF